MPERDKGVEWQKGSTKGDEKGAKGLSKGEKGQGQKGQGGKGGSA